MSGEFNVAEFERRDFAAATEFLSSVFGVASQQWKIWFDHWWENNPAWNQDVPRGWIVRATDGQPIAFTANIPFHYIIAGRPALCLGTGSTAVHPQWRGRGVSKAVAGAFVNQRHGDLLLGVESTDIAFRLWRSLGMQALDRRWLGKNYRLVADARAWVHALSRRAGIPEAVASLIARCAGGAVFAYAPARGRTSAFSVEKIDAFSDSDRDSILSCRASDAATYSLRDVATLNWLYFSSQYHRETRAVFAARSGAELVGYLAMKRRDAFSYYLLECRCRNADPEIARDLLLAARVFAQERKAAYVMVRPYTAMIEKALPSTICIAMSRPSMTYCYKFRNATASTPNAWEASPADGDVAVN